MYQAHVYCANCGWIGDVELPKGFPVLGAECPTCSCRALRLPKAIIAFRGKRKTDQEES